MMATMSMMMPAGMNAPWPAAAMVSSAAMWRRDGSVLKPAMMAMMPTMMLVETTVRSLAAVTVSSGRVKAVMMAMMTPPMIAMTANPPAAVMGPFSQVNNVMMGMIPIRTTA